MSIFIRPYRQQDIAQVHHLMMELAKFEGYYDDFHVSKDDLADALETELPPFNILVATDSKDVIGLLVYYFLPFTYDMKPWLQIKELYVMSDYRNMRVGRALMSEVQMVATNCGCSRITWQVLANNKGAQKFYQSIGAKHQDNWQLYHLTL